MSSSRHVVAIIGGATAGAETAAMLADRGALVIVFEQNPRPFGKIEDGLPRWHAKLRQKEYDVVNSKLDRPDVHFVPLTRIGRDIDFAALAAEWGLSAIILAVGAWRDRALPVEGADRYIGHGLIYQNPFIRWFNRYEEPGYDGPTYDLSDGAIVVGGGLASLDVVKVLQIESVRRALAARGIREDVLRVEHLGIGALLALHGLSWEGLGLREATLYYRRRIEDMPLAEMPEAATAEKRTQFEAIRRKIVDKAMQKYMFRMVPLRIPAGLIVEDDRLVGLRFQHTRVDGAKVSAVDGAFEDVRAPLVVSSIGSIPEAIPGITGRGELYEFSDRDLGRVAGYDTVFAAGNVVTGKGNIAASRRHSIEVSTHLIEEFLGLAPEGHAGEERYVDRLTETAHESGEKFASWIAKRPPLDAAQVDGILARVRARQQAVGFTGSYREWIARFTAPESPAE